MSTFDESTSCRVGVMAVILSDVSHSQATKHGKETHIINTTKQKEEPGGTQGILQNWTSGGHPRGTTGEG
jgi:hypothetical protein